MELETSIELIDNLTILSECGIHIDVINETLTSIMWEFPEELN